MKILVLGSGGREHAIAWKLAQSPRCEKLYVAPGNGGTAQIATNVSNVDILDAGSILGFVEEYEIDMVVIGPEAPLVVGVADELRKEGVLVFGPNASGARLEGSKSYSKHFMECAHIPSAAAQVFSDETSALAYVREQGAPIVVKADGLAAGKGVVVAETLEAAEDAVRACFDGAFGDAGQTVLIEEFMSGIECSLLAFVTEGKAFCMECAQDHKRAFDGDRGPNTGGMGAYSPVPMVTDEELAAMREIMEKAARATLPLSSRSVSAGDEATGNENARDETTGDEPLGAMVLGDENARDGANDFDMDYRGVLYGGFMLGEAGPRIVEFNARFGDPETQVVLVRLESDLVDIMEAVAVGRPQDIHLSWSPLWAVCVVLASEGYPGSYEKGKVILGVEEAEELEGVRVFHAGTAFNYDGELVTSGGRVLNVVALGENFQEARERAYRACDLINFEGKQYRSDIGAQAAAFSALKD